MATPETLEALELPGHRPSAPGTGADHPMRTMTRRAAGLLDPPWDREAASEVAALFDSLAPEWHTRESADRAAIVRDALDRGLDPLVRPRSAGPGGTPPVAVELGAGLGTYSGEIAARFSLCLAVELSAEMHRLAHPSGAHRILADGSRLPVPDGSVDAVVLVNCFLFPHEVQRVLRVGGVVLWVNSSGTSTPIHLSTDEVVAALPFATSGVESRRGRHLVRPAAGGAVSTAGGSATDLFGTAAALIDGRLSIHDRHPVSISGDATMVEAAEDVTFVESFANVTAVNHGGELVLVDTGSPLTTGRIRESLRTRTGDPLVRAVYTHGHVDHCFGVEAWEAEPGAPEVEVVAHEALPARFGRYRLTAGYNGIINQRQFRLAAPLFPEEFRYPDRTYRESTTVDAGGLTLELHHDRGETDDHTWVWIPERATLCTGDLFLWVAPNCGNPQKVQRYPLEWAAALRRMRELGAEVLLPGHGLPIAGTERVDRVLDDTATYLESICAETLAMMNQGCTLDEIVHSVEPPTELAGRPYLQAIYDDPEFIVHNLWRLYGGWYDGDPSHLKAAPAGELAREIAALAGGPGALARRASELAAGGELRLAGHLAELAVQATPDDPEVHGVRAEVNRARVAAESSLMAKGIFGWAEHESALIARAPEGTDGGDGGRERTS